MVVSPAGTLSLSLVPPLLLLQQYGELCYFVSSLSCSVEDRARGGGSTLCTISARCLSFLVTRFFFFFFSCASVCV